MDGRINARDRRLRGARRLAICPECHCPLLQPVDCGDAGAGLWVLTSECPNCWALPRVVVDDAELETIERDLDVGVELLLETLWQVGRANMIHDVEGLIVAIHADALRPGDF